MRIATKKGDLGESCLYSGRKLKKSALIFDVLGDLDELNSVLGLAKVSVKSFEEVAALIDHMQEDVYRIMSIVGNEGQSPKATLMIEESDVEYLEEALERAENEVGIITKFIKPGVNEISARMHVARSVCRRAERKAVMHMEELKMNETIVKYLNRLSDLLFILAYKFDKMPPL